MENTIDNQQHADDRHDYAPKAVATTLLATSSKVDCEKTANDCYNSTPDPETSRVLSSQ